MQINEEIQCNNTVRANQFIGPSNRSNIVTETVVYELPVWDFRVWNALGTLLPATAAVDDLGISDGVGTSGGGASDGVFGTAMPHLLSEDLNSDGTAASYARTTFTLPPEYVSGGTITLRMYCNTDAGAASVDAEVYVASKTSIAISGSDLVTTTATAVTNTFGAKDFTISPTNRIAGDVLDIRIAVIGTTSVTANTIVRIPHIEMVLQVKG